MPFVAILLIIMDDNQRIIKSFDFAADITKQLIALSTAIISLCVAFTDTIFSSNAANTHSITLIVSLGFFVGSIVFGVITMMAMAVHLGNPNKNQTEKESSKNQSAIYSGNVRLFSLIQMSLFVCAIIISMIYILQVSSKSGIDKVNSKDPDKYLKIIRMSEYTIENGQINDTLYLETGLE